MISGFNADLASTIKSAILSIRAKEPLLTDIWNQVIADKWKNFKDVNKGDLKWIETFISQVITDSRVANKVAADTAKTEATAKAATLKSNAATLKSNAAADDSDDFYPEFGGKIAKSRKKRKSRAMRKTRRRSPKY